MSMRPLLFNEITRGEAAERAPGALVVVPVAATAQAADEIDVLVTPTLAIGASHHHFPFGGTLSLASETYYRAVRDLVISLIRDGFQRIFVINGHGGNHELIQVVVRD